MCKHNSTKCIWHQKGSLTIAKIIQETKNKIPHIKPFLPVTNTYKISKQGTKNGYQTAATIQNNLSEFLTDSMADSEFRNKNKKSKVELANKNTQKMN